MSLINDALKRAKQTQPEPSRTPAAGGPMQPVEYQRRGLPWYFLPTVLVVLGGGSWFLLQGWDAHRQAAAGYGNAITVKAREPAAPLLSEAGPAEAFMPAVNNTPAAPYTAVNRNFSLEDAPVASAPAGTEAVEVPSSASPPAAGPSFRLQGIFYRSANPSAMVNGKSVFIGDRVSGAQVKAIDRESVTLEYDGQTKTLTLD